MKMVVRGGIMKTIKFVDPLEDYCQRATHIKPT